MTDPASLTRFTSGGIAGRQERLSGPLRGLHRDVLRRFLETGAPPTAQWVRQAAAEHGLNADAGVDQLDAADAVHIVDGVVAVAYPFSGTPTPHRVELDGLPAVHAMCAIDALGLPAMTGRDGRITSADPHDGTPIEVTVRDGAWSWTPAGTVVVAARTAGCGTECGSFEVMCPHTVFHASAESARSYLAGHADLDAQLLGQDTAIERGRLNFGSLLTGNQPALDELAAALCSALGILDPAGQRLAIALYRLLAEGRPVAIADLASAAGLPESAAARTVGSWPAVFTDAEGRVTGFWGLAISELSPVHRYVSAGRTLYAWCAWDTLFLPARLGQPARVTSACPVTGEQIELTVTPSGITGTSHPGAVVSFLMPDGPFDSSVVQSFCHFVHFFATRQAGEQWTAAHPGTFLLTLGEAAELAARCNQRMFPDILGAP